MLYKNANSTAADFNGYVWTDRVINTLTVANDSDRLMFVRVQGDNGSFLDSPPLIRDIGMAGSGTGRVVLVDLQCQGDVGDVTVNAISGMIIGGDLYGDLQCLKRADAQSVLQGGGWEGTTNIISGDVLGNITLENAVLSGANIRIDGSLGSGVLTSEIDVNGGFYAGSTFQCGEVNAKIIANQVRGRFLTTTTSGESGDFNGEFIITDSLLADASIEIGGALTSSGIIRFLPDFDNCVAPNDGPIKGRISINHENTLTPGTAWLGSVRVGTTYGSPASGTLIAPEYTASACSIGGGSVGEAPFLTHIDDSIPLFGTNRTFTTSTEPAIFDLRHYGGVSISGSGVSVRLERQAICDDSSPTWEDVTAEWDFDYAIDSDDSVLLMTSSQNANFRNGYQYRFVVQNDPLVAGVVNCVLPDVSPSVPVEDYPTAPWFTVGNSCSADFDGSGTVDLADLNAVLADFDTPHETNRYADTNADGLVNLTDLNRVLADFDSLCCSASLLGAGAGDSIAQELGYTCADGFCDAIAEMTPTEREAAFDALLAEAAEW
ncbi:MAG: hypothetical protein ACF8MJ_02795 [Phycisphaerales bacterium JB050]